jgi:hypothetical protein
MRSSESDGPSGRINLERPPLCRNAASVPRMGSDSGCGDRMFRFGIRSGMTPVSAEASNKGPRSYLATQVRATLSPTIVPGCFAGSKSTVLVKPVMMFRVMTWPPLLGVAGLAM